MSHITYKIVEHDGGWAYTVNGVFSETFRSHAAALLAAKRAAAEQRTPGRNEVIQYETSDGKWHTETASGSDRPETDVEDSRYSCCAASGSIPGTRVRALRRRTAVTLKGKLYAKAIEEGAALAR